VTEEPFEVLGSAFVDDTNLNESLDDEDSTIADNIAVAQRGLDLFAGCIEMTGGRVRPDKSWWYAIDFLWQQGIWSLNYSTTLGDITVDDGTCNRHYIKQVLPDEAMEMLGVWLAPDGNNVRAVQEMRAKSMKWAEKIWTGFLCREDIWQSHNSQIMKSLEYPLLALALSRRATSLQARSSRLQCLTIASLEDLMVLDGREWRLQAVKSMSSVFLNMASSH